MDSLFCHSVSVPFSWVECFYSWNSSLAERALGLISNDTIFVEDHLSNVFLKFRKWFWPCFYVTIQRAPQNWENHCVECRSHDLILIWDFKSIKIRILCLKNNIFSIDRRYSICLAVPHIRLVRTSKHTIAIREGLNGWIWSADEQIRFYFFITST